MLLTYRQQLSMLLTCQVFCSSCLCCSGISSAAVYAAHFPWFPQLVYMLLTCFGLRSSCQGFRSICLCGSPVRVSAAAIYAAHLSGFPQQLSMLLGSLFREWMPMLLACQVFTTTVLCYLPSMVSAVVCFVAHLSGFPQ
jgi:hypothetical protein